MCCVKVARIWWLSGSGSPKRGKPGSIFPPPPRPRVATTVPGAVAQPLHYCYIRATRIGSIVAPKFHFGTGFSSTLEPLARRVGRQIVHVRFDGWHGPCI